MANQYNVKAIQDNLKDAEKRRKDCLTRMTVWQEQSNQSRIEETLVQIARLDSYIAELGQELNETLNG